MKILGACVLWNEGWSDDPELEITVDSIPDHKTLRYGHSNGCYFAKQGDYIHFLYHSGNPVKQNGNGGCAFELTMKDNSTIVLFGPWTSRSAVMTKQGFTPSAEVIIQTGERTVAGCITKSAYIDAVKKFCPGVTVEEKTRRDETTLFLRRTANPCKYCKGAGIYSWDGRLVTCSRCIGSGHEPKSLPSNVS
ncbi:MAG: hypothetical protein HYX90_05270 [Chloroflexi bacterium]|nr:hypothetical protein [Chloroflexota bacterium]